MSITVLKEAPGLRLGVVGPVLVNVWYAEVNVPALQVVTAEQRRLAEEHGAITLISLALTIPRAPSKEAAEHLKEMEKTDLDRHTRGTIIAILARGLGAVFARSFIAAISLFSKQSYIVVKDVAEAARAARALPGQVPEIASMDSLADELAAFAALPPPAGS